MITRLINKALQAPSRIGKSIELALTKDNPPGQRSIRAHLKVQSAVGVQRALDMHELSQIDLDSDEGKKLVAEAYKAEYGHYPSSYNC
jgi:hypothetical protein